MNPSQHIDNLGIDKPENLDSTDIDDLDTLRKLHPDMQRWWVSEFGQYIEENNGFFTPPQKDSIPCISDGKNTLIASPTGSGKTLSAFASQINSLYKKSRNDELDDTVYCLYISPLKSLANDINKNLERPLQGVQEYAPEYSERIRQAIRHGDTSDSKKKKMLDKTPHILNTTPETLSILLNAPKFREKLRTVETIIVDEIHSLASNKRGVHLSLSLERLERITETTPVRIGCSATVEPLDEIGNFLSGNNVETDEPRECEIVDKRFVRDTKLSVRSPVSDLIQTDKKEISTRFYESLNNDIQNHSTTIVFTNTRSGAESTLSNLRSSYGSNYDETNSAVHHSSLGKEKRKKVERNLKEGTYDVVTTSTSLELGIDMKDIDLVVQVGSPKSIASLLQRIGRAGHQLGEQVEGLMYVLDRDELVECATMARQAQQGFIDRVFVPRNAQDVVVQHIYGMAINSIIPENELYRTIKSAYPYSTYTKEEFDQVLRYMTADYEGMEDRNVYPKIWRDTNDAPTGEHHYEEFGEQEKLIGKRGKKARVIYYTNIGTIPDSFSCDLYTRSNDTWVGELDEEYLNTLNKGDVIQLGGSNFEYRYRRGSKIYVDRTSRSPTVPSWYSERLPLSYDLGEKILEFQSEVLEKVLMGNEKSWIQSNFPVDENATEALSQLYINQVKFLDCSPSASTKHTMIVESHQKPSEDKRLYYCQSCYGRKFNDGMSRLLAQYFANKRDMNVSVSVSDQGFVLKVPVEITLDIESAFETIMLDDIRDTLKNSLEGTDFVKRYFRINAGRSLMILRNYKGQKKSAKQQQVQSEMLLGYASNLDNFAVLEETYREILEDKLNVDKVSEFIRRTKNGDININVVNVDTPSPRSFETATIASDDVVKSDDKSKVLKRFKERVEQKVGED